MFSFFIRNNQSVTYEWIGIDIHSHLLPGIDDGAPDISTSLQLFNNLIDLGLHTFICTPHIFTEIYPNNSITINNALETVKSQLLFPSNSIEILAAAEYMIDGSFSTTIDQSEVMTFPQGHILVETSYISKPFNFDQELFSLATRGFKPIIAHPERYMYYQSSYNDLLKLKEAGYGLQLNLLSVTGYYGEHVKTLALKLLKQKMYTYIGTDCHHERHVNIMRKSSNWNKMLSILKDYEFSNKDLL